MSTHAFNWSEWLQPQLPAECAVAAVTPGARVVVYGAGTAAEGLIEVLRRRGVNVCGVIDGKSKRSEIAGLRVRRLEDTGFSTSDRARLTVVIGIFNAFVDISALRRELEGSGWKTVVDFTELHAVLPVDLGDRYWLTNRRYALAQTAEIAAVDRLWADELSRACYRALWRFRVAGDRSGMPQPDPARQYFAPDVPAWASPLRFVDCGACDGDTVMQIGRLGLNVEALAAFEPDLKNFAQLVHALAPLRDCGILTLAWACGVSRATQLLRFRADQGAGSTLDAHGETLVPCVALDDVLGGFRPNMIKMDVEGAENDALSGVRHTIERDRPGLAICVYHRPSDLWELPARIASWNLGYRLFLRSHQYNGFHYRPIAQGQALVSAWK